MIKTPFILSRTCNRYKWYVIDAKNQILGRFASQITNFLLNKNDITYAPFLILHNRLIIINAKQIEISGNKRTQKNYLNYSGYQGGLKFTNFEKVRFKNPEKILLSAIRGMLPNNSIKSHIQTILYIYSNKRYKQLSQKPKFLKI